VEDALAREPHGRGWRQRQLDPVTAADLRLRVADAPPVDEAPAARDRGARQLLGYAAAPDHEGEQRPVAVGDEPQARGSAPRAHRSPSYPSALLHAPPPQPPPAGAAHCFSAPAAFFPAAYPSAYHPPPRSAKEDREIRRRTGPPHLSQVDKAGSVMRCSTSKVPQLVQLYSYVGMIRSVSSGRAASRPTPSRPPGRGTCSAPNRPSPAPRRSGRGTPRAARAPPRRDRAESAARSRRPPSPAPAPRRPGRRERRGPRRGSSSTPCSGPA